MSQTRWLDPDEQRTWRNYLAMHTRLNAALHRQLQDDSGLSLTDFAVLVQLTDRPEGRLRVGELATALEWEKSRLSHHLARMQRRDLIEREDCPNDARSSFIVLTPHGREAIEEAAPRHVESVRRLFFDHLAPEDVEILDTIARRILSGMDEGLTAPWAPAPSRRC